MKKFNGVDFFLDFILAILFKAFENYIFGLLILFITLPIHIIIIFRLQAGAFVYRTPCTCLATDLSVPEAEPVTVAETGMRWALRDRSFHRLESFWKVEVSERAKVKWVSVCVCVSVRVLVKFDF